MVACLMEDCGPVHVWVLGNIGMSLSCLARVNLLYVAIYITRLFTYIHVYSFRTSCCNEFICMHDHVVNNTCNFRGR